MYNQTASTAEQPVSKTKEVILKESKRIEEALLYTSKSHFAAAHFWSKFHLCIGIPMVLLSGVAGASAFAQFDKSHVVGGVLSIIVATLSGMMAFLNPNAKEATHLLAGNNYDSLMNKVRIFWSLDLWRDESEQVLTKRLKDFSEQKDKLNRQYPQPARWFYNTAKKGIESGEGDYLVDNSPPAAG
jgi:hypothetical protein